MSTKMTANRLAIESTRDDPNAVIENDEDYVYVHFKNASSLTPDYLLKSGFLLWSYIVHPDADDKYNLTIFTRRHETLTVFRNGIGLLR